VYNGRFALAGLYNTVLAGIVTTEFAIPSFLFTVHWITVHTTISLHRSFAILSIFENSVKDIRNVISAD
jgi:hypothetical protein